MSGKIRTPLIQAAATFGSLAVLGLLGNLIGCSGEVPECPPGTAFDDCKVSPASLRPSGQTTGGGATAGAGGSGAGAVPAGSGGSSSETPVSMMTPVATPPPPVVAPPPATLPAATADACPDDPLKTAAGECGCGVPEDDFDGDGAVDCREMCPDNAARVAPMGACGCSLLTDVAGCTGLRDALRNLYTFNGTGTTIIDSVGARNGTLNDLNGAAQNGLQQNGRVNLDGVGSFVNLPAGLISELNNATFEAWVSWRGGAPWARVFDFGSNNGNQGLTYLFLTPSNSENNGVRVAYSINGGGDQNETLTEGPMALAVASAQDRTLQHVAVVVDATGGALRLYANGVQVGTVAFNGDLGLIQDTNNWLGRSNYSVDPMFFGSLIEFRIYDLALTGTQIDLSFRAGPGALG